MGTIAKLIPAAYVRSVNFLLRSIFSTRNAALTDSENQQADDATPVGSKRVGAAIKICGGAMPIGVALGAGVGAALGNVAIGVAIGIPVSVGLAFAGTVMFYKE